jgi:hypothetical protein
MRNLLRLAMFSLLVMLVPFLSTDIKACSCPDIPLCARYWRSNVVFEGIVTDISPPNKYGVYPESAVVSLSVETLYRGSIGRSVITEQGIAASCRYVYQKGKRYLIYAYYDSQNKIEANLCTRIREVAYADEDLAYIRSLSQGVNRSSLLGKVSDDNPLKGVKVEAEGGGKKYKTVTDDEGRFAIKLKKPGKYKVRAFGPEKSRFGTYPEDGKLFDRKGRPVLEFREEVQRGGCAYVELHIDRESNQ